MSDFHDCPKCGASNSAHSDGFCGKCEGEYQAQQADEQQQEIAGLQADIRACRCYGTEGCGTCHRRLARVYELQGDHGKAAMHFNM